MFWICWNNWDNNVLKYAENTVKICVSICQNAKGIQSKRYQQKFHEKNSQNVCEEAIMVVHMCAHNTFESWPLTRSQKFKLLTPPGWFYIFKKKNTHMNSYMGNHIWTSYMDDHMWVSYGYHIWVIRFNCS